MSTPPEAVEALREFKLFTQLTFKEVLL